MKPPAGSLHVPVYITLEDQKKHPDEIRALVRTQLMNAADSADLLLRNKDRGHQEWIKSVTNEVPQYVIFEFLLDVPEEPVAPKPAPKPRVLRRRKAR